MTGFGVDHHDSDPQTDGDREDTFLLAVTVTGASSRMAARHVAYSLMPLGQRVMGSDGVVESWHDASMDSTDGHDDAEVALTYPGRGIEAQHALVVAGLAPEIDDAIGPHPRVQVIRNQDQSDGDVMAFICDRCNNGSDHPAVLAEVPCIDLDKWEHSHLWVSDDIIMGGRNRVTCLSDCGMWIEDGRVLGEVSDDAAGEPPQ